MNKIKFLKTLNALSYLKLEGITQRSPERRYYHFDFNKPVDVVTNGIGITGCTCKQCSVKLSFDCVYCFGVRLIEILPYSAHQELIKVMKEVVQ